MKEIKTGSHTSRSYSRINKSTVKNGIEYKENKYNLTGYVTLILIILVFIVTFSLQLTKVKKYEWYYSGLVSTTIISCLNTFWAIGRVGFLSSLRYSIHSSLQKMKVFEIGKKLGDKSYIHREKISNYKEYHEYCLEKIQYTKMAFFTSIIINLICAIIFFISTMVCVFIIK
ncbi:MAG: hypothetical protein ACRCW6_00305 [Mycoplasmoidaceae bacterium]